MADQLGRAKVKPGGFMLRSVQEGYMDFDFNDDQKSLRDQASRFLADHCGVDVPRRIMESDEPYAQDLWEGLAEQGWMATAIPEEYGGIGFGYLELCVLAEELGRVCAPVPFSSTVYLAAEAIVQGGSDAQKAEWLPKIAAGETIGTLAFAEGSNGPNADNLETTFDGSVLNGTKIPVVDGDVAHIGIVVAKGADGPVLALVDLNGDGVTREAVATLDPTRTQAKVTFTNAPAEALGDSGWDTLQLVLNRAAVLYAFEQLGGSDTCLRMAREYSLERYAFGRPIGSFQALKHRMSDMYAKNELARSNCFYGAWALSTDAEELAEAAACARISAIQAYHFASKENIQIHGGIGFTWEADCHFFYKRSKQLSLVIGGELTWKERLVSVLEAQPVA